MARSISVGAAVSAGFGFVRPGLAAAPAAAVLVFVLSFGGTMALSRADWLAAGLWLSATYLAGIVYAGALFRKAIEFHLGPRHGDPIGPGGLQWRGLEWRVLAVTSLVFALLGTLLLVGMIAIIVALAGALPNGPKFPPPATDVPYWAGAGVAAIALICVYYWLRLRLWLAPMITAAQGRVTVRAAFALTKGQFWRLLGATLLVGLPFIGLGVVTGFLNGVLKSLGAAGLGLFLQRLMTLAGSAAYLPPVGAGLAASVYAQLSDRPDRDAEVF